jgi:hypothetical protein
MRSSFRGLSKFLTGAAFVAIAFLAPTCQPSGGDYNGGSEGGSDQSGGQGEGGSSAGGSAGGGSGGSNAGGSETGGSNSGGSAKGGSGGGGSGGSNSGGSSNKGGSGGGSGGSGSGGSASGGSGSGGSGGGSGGVGGGSGGSGGGAGGTVTSGTKNTGTTVTFAKGKAAGAMTGYGWVALGKLDSVTDPTCGPSKTAITSTAACASDPNWSATDKLCISGGCPALPASPTSTDYADNYGIVVGVNAGDKGGTGDASEVLGQSFKTISVAASGMPSSEVRIQIHKKGDPDSTSYCIKYSSSAIDLTKFATDCYATSPTGLFKAADIPNIDKVSLEAVSASTAVTVTSMCITGITFGL